MERRMRSNRREERKQQRTKSWHKGRRLVYIFYIDTDLFQYTDIYNAIQQFQSQFLVNDLIKITTKKTAVGVVPSMKHQGAVFSRIQTYASLFPFFLK